MDDFILEVKMKYIVRRQLLTYLNDGEADVDPSVYEYVVKQNRHVAKFLIMMLRSFSFWV